MWLIRGCPPTTSISPLLLISAASLASVSLRFLAPITLVLLSEAAPVSSLAPAVGFWLVHEASRLDTCPVRRLLIRREDASRLAQRLLLLRSRYSFVPLSAASLLLRSLHCFFLLRFSSALLSPLLLLALAVLLSLLRCPPFTPLLVSSALLAPAVFHEASRLDSSGLLRTLQRSCSCSVNEDALYSFTCLLVYL